MFFKLRKKTEKAKDDFKAFDSATDGQTNQSKEKPNALLGHALHFCHVLKGCRGKQVCQFRFKCHFRLYTQINDLSQMKECDPHPSS